MYVQKQRCKRIQQEQVQNRSRICIVGLRSDRVDNDFVFPCTPPQGRGLTLQQALRPVQGSDDSSTRPTDDNDRRNVRIAMGRATWDNITNDWMIRQSPTI